MGIGGNEVGGGPNDSYRISLIRNHLSATAQWNPTAPLTVAG